jgi:hypothetical protein
MFSVATGVFAVRIFWFDVIPVVETLVFAEKVDGRQTLFRKRWVEVGIEINEVPIEARNWKMIVSKRINAMFRIEKVVFDGFEWTVSPFVGWVKL